MPAPLRPLWRLELLAYWQQAGANDQGAWWPFLRLAGLVLWLELVAALWLLGGLRPLSAL